uniref:J domain-containing protein n=1 Tax=Panagrolaimus davidi TaxID=227884 RepID=A0A914P436_9BILA
MASCRTIALVFAGILINNALLLGIFVAIVMYQEAEKEPDHQYNNYNQHYSNEKSTSLISKIVKWSGKSFIRRILEYIPGFEVIAKRFDDVSTVVYVVLDTVFLPFEAIQSIHLWFNGEISGRRCAKTVVDATIAVAGGIGGAALGAGVGSVGGPVGTIIGGIIGGLFGSSVAKTVVGHLTERIFDLPKNIAVERAYYFLGISPSASNYDVNQAFRKLASQYHPDKRYGSEKLFMELQSNMQLITEDQLAIPHLEKTKGAIVNVSLIGSQKTSPQVPFYCIAKAGLDHFARNYAAILAPKGIRIKNHNPGGTSSAFISRHGVSSEMEKKSVENCVQNIPLQRFAEPKEMAEFLFFMASEKASYMTGQITNVDGGTLINSPNIKLN